MTGAGVVSCAVLMSSGAVVTRVVDPSTDAGHGKVSVAFETKGYCDVTIAIENTQGKIIRHLACGVLGSKAPKPFQKDSKKQTVVWDGKDDQQHPLDAPHVLNRHDTFPFGRRCQPTPRDAARFLRWSGS